MTAQAVFFISFGGPEKPDEVRPFLEIVTRGRKIPAERIEEVAHHYEQIGGASPINAITRRQAEGLQAVLAKSDTPLPVYVGNRNWHPFLEDTLRQMAAKGIRETIGFITAAHRTEASHERYIEAIDAARKNVPNAPSVTCVDPWFDHPLFIEAIAARVWDELAPLPSEERKRVHWIFTAHSIPTPMAKATRYVEEIRSTAERVARRLNQPTWDLAYTSRSGRPQDPWLEPDVCDLIAQLGSKGVKEAIAIPIGFIADHVEVLFDLDVEARETAQKAGIQLRRAQTVSDHPLFVQMIANVVRQKLSE